MGAPFQFGELVRETLLWELGLGTPGIPPYVRPAPAPIAPKDLVGATAALNVLKEEAASCSQCGLHEGRTQSVFARGNPGAELVFVGEGPGYDEDQAGSPFVGKAGQLLDKMIGAMGLSQDDVYICNVVKCRPPENRTPTPEEASACRPFLLGQLEAVRPKIIVALGRCAAEHLGAVPERGGWRGQWSEFAGVRVMPTYHPAFLLRTPNMKRPVWEDLKQVVEALGRTLP